MNLRDFDKHGEKPDWYFQDLVFFLQAGDEGRPILIGRSTSGLATRRKSLQAGCPETLRYLGVVPSYEFREGQVRERFAALHHNLRWFLPGPALLDFIRDHAYPVIDDEVVRTRICGNP